MDTASDCKEALETSLTDFYILTLKDIRLPDMEGTKLVTAMKETTPEMIKIILTRYPHCRMPATQ